MPVSDQDLSDAKQVFVDNTNILKNIVQGDENTSVSTPSGAIDSIRKLQKNVLQDYAHVEQQANRDATNGYPSLSGYKLALQNVAGAVKSYLASLATASRNWQMPDKDGTVAMTSDITAAAVGLNLVNNTADADKPISTAAATAFAARELLANKAVDFTTVNDTKFPTIQAVKTYVDNATTGLLNDRGNWSGATGTYPNTGGSGTSGAIKKGDTYYINVAGNLGGVVVNVGDSVRAMANAPGQTAANWNILEGNVGYVPENAANKDTTGGYAGLTVFKLNVMNAAGNVKSFFTTLATSARTYTLPDKDGTIAMLSDLTSGEATANKDATGGYVGLTLFKINFKNAANTFTSFFTNANTAARTYLFPDYDATIATQAGTETLTNKTLTNPTLTNFTESGAAATVSAYTIDLANGTDFEITTNGNLAITLPTPVAGKSYTLTIVYGGAHSVTFSGGGTIAYPGGTAPNPTSVSGKTDLYVMKCNRAGTKTFIQDGGRNF